MASSISRNVRSISRIQWTNQPESKVCTSINFLLEPELTPSPAVSDGEAPISIFGYIPNKALGCVGAIIFALCFVGHFGLFLRLKPTRMFQGLMTFGCVMEVVGYCFRLLAHCTIVL